ncbi:GNAT family N-acetyltransferase [Georgenia yuyongxinii]|uniref:GNAT family N-acetyltransferase n=1 Tax=Georgenia yuyongxinii TaxID=2589797 RepID=UPI00163D96CC|nr:GNAT family N-acetyltransferase [Georgenia yuyongxinii]
MLIVPRHRADPALAALLVAAVDELNTRYPEESTSHDLDPRARFLVADVEGRAAGCVALVQLERAVGEVKRMFVAPSFRGRGIATRLLAGLEMRARAAGMVRLVLETGVRQPESVALYEKAGFGPVAPYGSHVGSSLSLCFAKDLADGAA